MRSDVKTPLREVRLRVAMMFALIMMSNDSLNPVKVLCDMFNLKSYYFTALFVAGFAGIILANINDLLYFMTKVFFHSIMSIFFSSVEVLGKENVPAHGPIIFTGNHMNQFVDGAVVMVTNPHKVSFLVAESSMKKRIVGDFARAAGGIPVSRAQDKPKMGPGKICFDGLKIYGQGTKFTELKKGDKIRPAKSPESYKIKVVLSDTEGELANDYGEASPLDECCCQGTDKWCAYDILEYVDQSKMFDAVQAALSEGKCLGIFPEGGSHDNTDLLPLKIGVAAIALGVMEKYDLKVPIVPVGLNYFRGHRFRGRVVVEFGQPIHITKDLVQLMKSSRRESYHQLLKQIEGGMRSVIVTAPDYVELKLIHTIRRLYQRTTATSTVEKQDLAKRIGTAFKLFRQKYSAIEDGKPVLRLPEDMLELKRKLENYQNVLEKWGLRDYQLLSSHIELPYRKLLYIFLHGACVFCLASIPSLVLNAPVGFAAHIWADREAKKDLQKSRVKLHARDVLLSKKIIFSIAAVPTLWVFYAILLCLFTTWQYRTILILFLCCPIFSYVGVMAVEAGMVDLKTLRPAFLRLLPEFKGKDTELPRLRMSLAKEVRAMIKKYGPEMGPVYFEKIGEWESQVKDSHLLQPVKRSSSRGSSVIELPEQASSANLAAIATNERLHAEDAEEDTEEEEHDDAATTALIDSIAGIDDKKKL